MGCASSSDKKGHNELDASVDVQGRHTPTNAAAMPQPVGVLKNRSNSTGDLVGSTGRRVSFHSRSEAAANAKAEADNAPVPDNAEAEAEEPAANVTKTNSSETEVLPVGRTAASPTADDRDEPNLIAVGPADGQPAAEE
jgi:hypothetical protein